VNSEDLSQIANNMLADDQDAGSHSGGNPKGQRKLFSSAWHRAER